MDHCLKGGVFGGLNHDTMHPARNLLARGLGIVTAVVSFPELAGVAAKRSCCMCVFPVYLKRGEI